MFKLKYISNSINVQKAKIITLDFLFNYMIQELCLKCKGTEILQAIGWKNIEMPTLTKELQYNHTNI